MKSIVFLSFVLISTSVLSEEDLRTYKLELVQALIRNGDSTPEKSEIYKTDPYDPKNYMPIGYGQLTTDGMQRMYQTGQLLWRLYKTFIGEYRSSRVYAYSTDYDYTRASLQVVLAGLFPQLSSSPWNKRLKWIPIPVHYDPMNSNFLESSFKGSCGGLDKVQQLVKTIPEVQQYMTKYKDFLIYMQNQTEIKDTDIYTVATVTTNLLALRSMNLTLPEWCTEEDFDMLYDILALNWHSLSMTPELRKQIAGPMVKQFLDNMKNHDEDDKIRMYLYSGHDFNLATYTGAHNFTGIPPIPDFGSALLIEKLQGSDGQAYVRMLLWNGQRVNKLKLEPCDYECPLGIYEQLVLPLLPDPELVECISRNLHCNEGPTSKANSLGSKIYLKLMITMVLLLSITITFSPQN